MCVGPCGYGTLRLSFLWCSVNSFPLFVGLRYSRSRQRTKFISVISLISVVGITLGMTVLITVLSVFNGFQREVRTRMLSAVAHVQVTGLGESLRDWQSVAAVAAKNPHVVATAPYVSAQGLLTSGGNVRGALLRGIEPAAEEKVSEIGAHMRSGTLESLRSGEYNVVLGAPLARALGVTVGERVVLVAPQGQVTPAGILPRLRQFTVTGTFEVGHYEIDAGLAVVHIEDAQRLYRMDGGVSGVRLKLDDLFLARQVSRELLAVLPPEVSVSDWSRFNATYFRAVELEKRMMSLLLFFIIAIAAFNMVSSLYMMVREKQADIAILRTMGASPGEVMRIFIRLRHRVRHPRRAQRRQHHRFHRTGVPRQVHAPGRLPDCRPAVRAAGGRRGDDRGGGFRAVGAGDDLPELARVEGQSGGGAAL